MPVPDIQIGNSSLMSTSRLSEPPLSLQRINGDRDKPCGKSRLKGINMDTTRFSRRDWLKSTAAMTFAAAGSATWPLKAKGVLLNAFDRCSPRENLESRERETSWEVLHTQVAGIDTPLLYAGPAVVRSTVRYPLDHEGIHDIFVRVHVAAGSRLPRFRLSLSGSGLRGPGTECVAPDKDSPRLVELHWGTADLSGRDILIEKIEGYPVSIAGFRLEPVLSSHQATGTSRSAVASAQDAFQVALNGQVLSGEQRWFRLGVGQPHRLEVTVTDGAPRRCEAEVQKILPDGSVQRWRLQVTPDHPTAGMDLGLLAAPARYEFEHGTVYRRGYRILVKVHDAGTSAPLARFDYYQGIPYDKEGECLYPGREERVILRPPLFRGYTWLWMGEDGYTMNPFLSLRLAWPAGRNGLLRVEYATKQLTRPVTALLHVANAAGRPIRDDVKVIAQPATLPISKARVWGRTEIAVGDWPEGDYRIALHPVVNGTAYEEGPSLTYRHRREDRRRVLVSPWANWALDRDTGRKELSLPDMQTALEAYADPESASMRHWRLEDGKLVSTGHAEAEPVRLSLSLEGRYALFVRPLIACMVRLDQDPAFFTAKENPVQEECFLGVFDLTDRAVEVLPPLVAGHGVSAMRFVPVTPESADALIREIRQPTHPLHGISDWHGIYGEPGVVRVDAADMDMQLVAHRDLGIRTVHWACGRGFLYYHSSLPYGTLIGSEVEPGGEMPEYIRFYLPLYDKVDPLDYIVQQSPRYEQTVSGWLCMNRFYRGGKHALCSVHHASHPEWHHRTKSGSVDASRASYFFEEPRTARVELLVEIARRGANGLTMDFVRQPPMMDYHPAAMTEFQRQTGIDPAGLDGSSGQPWLQWIRWRAEFVTMILRQVRRRLADLELETGRRVPIAARVPSEGLLINLAQGCDVETWCREHLVDALHVVCMSWSAGGDSQDVRPYVELARATGVRLVGSDHVNTFDPLYEKGPGPDKKIGKAWSNPVAFLKRAIGLVQSGVKEIELYESEMLCEGRPSRWLTSLAGHPDRAREYLESSNLEACFPVEVGTALGGFDNHSAAARYTMFDGPDDINRLGNPVAHRKY